MPNRATRADSPHRQAAIDLGRRLRSAREAKNLSQQEVATRATVAIGTVQALERGRSVDPSFFTVVTIAWALDVDLSSLVSNGQGSTPVGISKVDVR